MAKKSDPEREQYMQAIAELIGGRVVSYHPRLARLVGGVKAAVLLSQLLFHYCSKPVRERGGWLLKSVDEMEDETGLNKVEQKNARRSLMELGVVNCELRGVPRIWRYQVDLDKLSEVILGTSVGFRSHWERKSPNEKVIQRETHSMKNSLDDLHSDIGPQSDPTLSEFPTQLKYDLKMTTNLKMTSQMTTTTTMLPSLDMTGLQAASSNLVVVVWDAAISRLREIGIIEKQIPDYITLAQAGGWMEQQLIGLTNRLEQEEGRSKACRLLKYRIENETPSRYGYANYELTSEPEWWFSEQAVFKLQEARFTGDQIFELDDIARAQSWDENRLLALLPRFESPDAFMSSARNTPGAM